jgi:hypothetical protein
MKPIWVWILIGIVALIAFFALLPPKPSPLPDELVGVWKTSDPKYSDRYLDLSKASIIFGTGKETIDANFISNVEKLPGDGAILYTVHFHHLEGPEDKVSFYYAARNDGIIWFKNQGHVVWSKEKDLR